MLNSKKTHPSRPFELRVKDVDLRKPSIALVGKVPVSCVSGEFAENVVSLSGQKVSDGGPIPRPR